MEADQHLGMEKDHHVKKVFAKKFNWGNYSYHFQCTVHSLGINSKRYDLFVKRTDHQSKIIGKNKCIVTKGVFLLRHFKKFRMGYIERKQVLEKTI